MHRYARLSLISVILTAVMITANHTYTLGARAFILGLVLIVGPVGLLWWYRNTKSRLAFNAYLAMNLWIIIGFGLLKGLWDITLKLFLGSLLAAWSTSFPIPALGTYGYEASGILTFIGSLFVLYYAFKLVQAKREAEEGPARPEGSARRSTGFLTAGAVVAIAAVVGGYFFADRDRWVAPGGGTVRIGVVVPTSGPYFILGNSFLKAVQMARSDLHRTTYRYELVVVPIGTNPGKARDAIGWAIRNERLNAIVGGISLFGQVTAPLATAARIPHLCVCTVASIGDGGYNFTNIPSPEAEAVRWVQEAQRRGIRTVSLLTQDYPSIHNHVKALKTELARAGLVISSEREFADSVTDFRAMITQARRGEPDIFYVEALNPQLDILGQQLAAAGVRNIASVVAPSLSRKPEFFEDVWYTDSNLRDVAFKARFEARYPGTQFATHMMPYGYDSFNMIVQAFEQRRNPAAYLRAMTTYPGTAGPLSKARGSGNFQSNPAVWIVRNGKPELTSTE
jgi:ABC-type branched-subunit amino acid transport system substrate-binding protein